MQNSAIKDKSKLYSACLDSEVCVVQNTNMQEIFSHHKQLLENMNDYDTEIDRYVGIKHIDGEPLHKYILFVIAMEYTAQNTVYEGDIVNLYGYEFTYKRTACRRPTRGIKQLYLDGTKELRIGIMLLHRIIDRKRIMELYSVNNLEGMHEHMLTCLDKINMNSNTKKLHLENCMFSRHNTIFMLKYMLKYTKPNPNLEVLSLQTTDKCLVDNKYASEMFDNAHYIKRCIGDLLHLFPNMKRVVIDNTMFGYINAGSLLYYCKGHLFSHMFHIEKLSPGLTSLVPRYAINHYYIPIIEYKYTLKHFIERTAGISKQSELRICISPNITSNEKSAVMDYINKHNTGQINTKINSDKTPIAIVNLPKDIYP